MSGQEREPERKKPIYLSLGSEQVLSIANQSAVDSKSIYISSEHLTFGLLTTSNISRVLTELEIEDPEEKLKFFVQHLARIILPFGSIGQEKTDLKFSAKMLEIIEKASVFAQEDGLPEVEPLHLLKGLFETDEPIRKIIEGDLGFGKDELKGLKMAKKGMESYITSTRIEPEKPSPDRKKKDFDKKKFKKTSSGGPFSLN